MNRKLQEEREKAQALLQHAKQQQKFNLSDLKADKTQYFESPYNHSKRSPFKPSEMSARSTLNQKSTKQAFSDIDFDEIMRTTSSEAVRNKYRESIGMGRLSSFPRTADMSLRSSVSSNVARHSRIDSKEDLWDNVQVAPSTFSSKNCSVSSDCFKPAEDMAERMRQDEEEQEREYAPIPRVNQTTNNETNWEERGSMRQPEMSFGQYANCFYKGNDIREIYSGKSPSKDRKRVALIEMSQMETSADSNRLNTNHLQKMIKNYDTPKAQEMLMKFSNKVNQVHNLSSHMQSKGEKSDLVVSGISAMINSLNFDKIAELSMEPERLRAEKENEVDVVVPTFLTPDDALRREQSVIKGRGLKRRSSSECRETPKSTFDKCMRSKSPNQQKELMAVAATLLKPKLDENVFKVPHSYNSIRPNFSKSPSGNSQADATRSPSTREYLTVNSMMSGEKLSLPNYGLVRPDTSTSPSSSNGSHEHLSPNGSPQGGLLKRTVSQLSNGSEFHDDVLPIRIKKSQSKLSWESVKLYSTVSRTISIQNGSSKRLHLRVRVEGLGYSVTPREDLKMISLEARTLEVKFSPNVVGPSRGYLIFELATNNKCCRKIPLFAYGGHASIRIEGSQKGPIGPAFITLGLMKMLNSTLEQTFSITNYGTLSGFAELIFEKTKWSDFSLSESLTMTPNRVQLAPGESVNITVRFNATRDEIRKIIALNKEITIVGEICVISGDEPTRLRVINNKDILPKEFLDFLPKRMPKDENLRRELLLFNENLDKTKISPIMAQLKTNEIALTVCRNMDETLINAELSLADDSTMNFETFCETNTNRTLVDLPDVTSDDDTTYFFESKFFRILPAKIIFSRKTDKPGIPKAITVESICSEQLLAEAVSSRHDLVSAIKSCGVVPPEGIVEINVFPKLKAFTHRTVEPIFVSILIGNAKVDVPVKFVD